MKSLVACVASCVGLLCLALVAAVGCVMAHPTQEAVRSFSPSCLECHPSGCGCNVWQPAIGRIGAAPTEPIPETDEPKNDAVSAPCNPPPQPNAASANQLREKKTGQWRCLGCSSPFVGSHMHTTYTRHGEAITFLCSGCWEKKTATQRAELLDKFLSTQAPGAATERLRAAVQCDQ